MSDEPTSTPPVDEQQSPVPAEATETATPEVEAPITKEDEETAGKQATTEVNAPEGEETAEAAEGPSAPAGDETPTTNGKDKKRKSTAAIPEHKSKKLNKKKSMPNLHLDCKPGEYYWARLKGYPPWPAIICDEEMLPESLLASRPVSTARPDGTLREDFQEGGKNAKERTYPIMFLGTNEFAWLVNTGLTKLDPEEVKNSGKMTKALQTAYAVATENHDLQHFKDELREFQESAAQFEAEQQEAHEKRVRDQAEKAEKKADAKANNAADKEKKKSRKSTAAVDEDVEMEEAEAPKSSRKRKKDADSDGEGAKPKKTPKVTKLNAPKTPNGEAFTKKAASAKPKKKVSAPKVQDEEVAEEQKKEMTEDEKLQQREKAILYLRHRLQKGFLSRDQAPQEDEMSGMAEFFGQLEGYSTLEPSIIRTTKIHKVLKAIVKLAVVPKDDEYNFKKRSHALLEIWNKRMEADGDGAVSKPAQEAKAPATNGDAKATETETPAPVEEAKEGAETEENETTKVADEVDEKVEDKAVDEEVEAKKDGAEEPAAAPSEKAEHAELESGNDAKDEADEADDADEVDATIGDVSMQTAPEEATEEATEEARSM